MGRAVTELGLKYDLRAPGFGASPADLYDAALDQCAWADETGFDLVTLLEHHGTDDGYCPSPLIVAAALAARTRRMRIRIRALVLPLHDPVRVAEDCAVLDVLSRGRLELVVAAGYVRSEYAMFGVDPADRGRLLERGVATLRAAFTGEPFVHDGRPGRVALRPHGPLPITLGGSSDVAARRAALIADNFDPTHLRTRAAYEQECARLGRAPGPPAPPQPRGQFLHVSADPEKDWARLGPHLLHEMCSYGEWLAAAGTGRQYRPVADLDELRATGVYRIVTPAECLALARELGPAGRLEFHPLVGGADPEIGWSGLRLFAAEVLPTLQAEGLVGRYAGPAGAR